LVRRNIFDTLKVGEGVTGMSDQHNLFWDDLAEDLEDPEFLREFVVESVRIATIDRVVNALDEAREAAGLTKADLARAISAEPAVVRRLFSSRHANPTLGTLAEVAAALGMTIKIETMPESERRQVMEPLLSGSAPDRKELARHVGEMRASRARRKVTA